MHDGCQFGTFTNLLFLRCLAVPIREPSETGVSKREKATVNSGTSHLAGTRACRHGLQSHKEASLCSGVRTMIKATGGHDVGLRFPARRLVPQMGDSTGAAART